MFHSFFYTRNKNKAIGAAAAAVFFLFAAGAGAATHTWNSTATDTNWTNTANWTPSAVPTSTDDVEVNTTTTNNYPSITADAAVKKITIKGMATVTLQSGTLTLKELDCQGSGKYLGNGSSNNGTGTTKFTGAAKFKTSNNNTSFGKLEIDSGTTLTVDTTSSNVEFNVTKDCKNEGTLALMGSNAATVNFSGNVDFSNGTLTGAKWKAVFDGTSATSLKIKIPSTGMAFDKLEVKNTVTSFTAEALPPTSPAAILSAAALDINSSGPSAINAPVKATTHIKHMGNGVLTLKKIEAGTMLFDDTSAGGANIEDESEIATVKHSGSGNLTFKGALKVTTKFEQTGTGGTTAKETSEIQEIAQSSGTLSFEKPLTVTDKFDASGGSTVTVKDTATIKELKHSGAGTLTFEKPLTVSDTFEDSSSAGATIKDTANIKTVKHSGAGALTFQKMLMVTEEFDNTSATGAETVMGEATIKKLSHKGNCTLTFEKPLTVTDKFDASGGSTVTVKDTATIKELKHSGVGSLTFEKPLTVSDTFEDSSSTGATIKDTATIKTVKHKGAGALAFQKTLTVTEEFDNTGATGAETVMEAATIKKLTHKGNCTLSFAKKATVQNQFTDTTGSGALSFNGGADFQFGTEAHFQSTGKLTLKGECKFAGDFKRTGGETDLGKDSTSSPEVNGTLTTAAANKNITFMGTGAKLTVVDNAACFVKAGSGACMFGDKVTATAGNLTVETTGTATFEKGVETDSKLTLKCAHTEIKGDNTFMTLNIDNSSIAAATDVKFEGGKRQTIKNTLPTPPTPWFRGNSATNRLTIESTNMTNMTKCKICFTSDVKEKCFEHVTIKNAESVDGSGMAKQLHLQQSKENVRDSNFTNPTTKDFFDFKFTWKGTENADWTDSRNWKNPDGTSLPVETPSIYPPYTGGFSEITIDTDYNKHDLELADGLGTSTPKTIALKLKSLTVNAGKRIGLGSCTIEASGSIPDDDTIAIKNNGTIALYGNQQTAPVLKSTATPPKQITHSANSTIEYCGNKADAKDVLSANTSGTSDGNYKNLVVKMDGGTMTFNHSINATKLDASGNADSAQIDLNCSTVTTTGGVQKYKGKVELKQDVTLTASAVTFEGELDGAKTLTAANATKLTFKGKVGSATPLTTLTSGTGTVTFDTMTAVKTSGAQTYKGTVELKQDAKIETTGAAQVIFEKEIDTESSETTEHSLTINSMAQPVFKSAVGQTKPLASLTVGTGKTTIETDKIKTKNKQEYGGAVELKRNAILETENDADIEFKDKVDSDTGGSVEYSLEIAGKAKPKFSGDVGGTKMLSMLKTGTGLATLDTMNIKTSGTQTYGGNVTLTKNVTLAANGTAPSVTFNGTVNGAHALTIANAASQTFNGDVGTATPLTMLTTSAGKTEINAATIKTTGAQNYKGAVELKKDTMIDAGSDTATFDSTIDSEPANMFSLSFGTATKQTFKGNIGENKALSWFKTGGETKIDTGGGKITTHGSQQYKGAIKLEVDATLKSSATGGSGVMVFSGTVDGAHSLTITAKDKIEFEKEIGGTTSLTTLTATADDSYIVLKGTAYKTSGKQMFKAKKGVRLMSSADMEWMAGGTDADGIKLDETTTDLYIEYPNATKQAKLMSPLHCRNFYFSSGKLDLSAKITAEKDFAVWGTAYNAADPRYDDTSNTRFAFWTDKMPYKQPTDTTAQAAGVYTPANHGASFGTFGSGAAIEVKGNFYINGADLEPTSALTLMLPDNSGSKSVFNKGKNVTKDQWGIPFAAAFNMKVKNVNATQWVAAATSGQGVQDMTGNTKWQFDVPEIAEAYTVYDDVVFVKFNMNLENSHGEINKNLAKATESGATKKDGGVWYNGGMLHFYGTAYSDKECTMEIPDNADLTASTGFYLKTVSSTASRATWNTDATGTLAQSASATDATDSTDRKGIHQSVKVDLSFLEGMFTAADGHTMCKNYGVGKDNGTAAPAYTQTTDKCAPVLVKVFTGQELHTDPDGTADTTTYAGAQKPYDAHNFIEFRYSEPVDIGTDMTIANKTMDAKQLNIQATTALGQITNLPSFTVAGLASFASGSVETGANGTTGTMNNAVHSLYRNFSRTAGGTPDFQSHRVRVAIAGYVHTTVSVGGKNYYKWLGYIDSATKPSGMVTRIANTTIKDAAATPNTLDAAGTAQHPLPSLSVNSPDTDLYGEWDTSPPMLSTFKPDHREGTRFQNTEAVGWAPPGASGLYFLEFHFFDNTTNPADWYLKYGWAQTGHQTLYKDFSYGADVFGGARAFDTKAERRTAGGIRYSSIHDKHSSFTLKAAGATTRNATMGTVVAGAKSLVFLPYNIPGVIPKSPATQPNLTDKTDGLYASIELADKTLYFGTVFSVTYNESGFITDLAGNRMKTTTTPVFTIDRTAPRFELTVAPVKDATNNSGAFKELYVVFNKKLKLGDIPFGNPTTTSPQLPPLGVPVITKMHEHLRFIDSTTFASISDPVSPPSPPERLLYVTKVREKFTSNKATGLILELSRPLTLEDIKTTFLQCWVPSPSTDPLTGISNVYVSYIQDDEGNYMSHQSAHAISDFAVNVVQPVYAYDGRYLNSGAVELTDNFEESLAAYDWNEEQAKLGTLVTEQDIFLYTKFNDGNAAPTLEKVHAYFDRVSKLSAGSVSENYNEKKSGVMDWRIWLPSMNFSQPVPEFPALTPHNNTIPKTSSLDFKPSPQSHDNVLIFALPYQGAASMSKAGWTSGDQISFLFGLADLSDNPIEICRNPLLTGASTTLAPIYDVSAKSPLFALRLKNPSDISSADLWSFKLQKQKSQRGGVTILNNVINASTGEKTTLQVDMPSAGRLDVIIMTLDGDIVQYLQRGQAESGTHYFTWDGTTKSGKSVARGLYFVRVFGSGIDETRKVMVVKE